jgi:hypothetical protein
MTAHRNGTFRRAALRLTAVAGLAAAAWFAGSAAAHAAGQQETPSEPATAFGEAHAAAGGHAHHNGAAGDIDEDRADTPDLIATLLRVPPELNAQRVVVGVDAVLTVQTQQLLTPALGAPQRPAPDSDDDAPARKPGDGTWLPETPQPDRGPVPLAPGSGVGCGQPALLDPVEPLLVQVVEPLLRPLQNLTAQLIQPVTHALTSVAGPLISAVPVGVLPTAQTPATPAQAQAATRAEAPVDTTIAQVVRAKAGPAGSAFTGSRFDLGRSPTGDRAPDGGGQAYPLIPDDCPPGGTPAGSSHGGAGAPSATMVTAASVAEPMARALRQAADSALRRAEAPRPTSSPD